MYETYMYGLARSILKVTAISLKAVEISTRFKPF